MGVAAFSTLRPSSHPEKDAPSQSGAADGREALQMPNLESGLSQKEARLRRDVAARDVRLSLRKHEQHDGTNAQTGTQPEEGGALEPLGCE
jgi:hypothetical protein